MGKANKIKFELRDAVEMVYLIQTLKDIADNKYYSLLNSKDKFRRFNDTFVEFFRMLRQTSVVNPLIHNDNPVTCIIAITVEGSFLGEFNNKITRLAIKEKEKHKEFQFLAVGNRSVEQLKKHTPDLKVFENAESHGFYETAVELKDYLIEQIFAGQIGKVVVCYTWPKRFETLKPKVVKLLPCDSLIKDQSQSTGMIEKVIEESDPKDVITYLVNLWVTTALYEMLIDSTIASAASQSQFLEESVDKLKKEKKKTQMRYLKARKADIDKSLRETFSARMISMEKAKAAK
jgi:ATP synthase F1 gamma subunit